MRKKIWCGCTGLLCLIAGTVYGENLVKNAGFEDEINSRPPSKYLRYFVKDWTISLNNGEQHSNARLSTDSKSGKYSLELISKDKQGSVSAFQEIEVAAGQTIKASVYAKGSSGSHGYARFIFTGEANNKLGTQEMGVYHVKENWTKFSTMFKVPAGAKIMRITVENIKPEKEGSVLYDDYLLEIDNGTQLENSFIRLNVSPATGGSIESFVIKSCQQECTMPNTHNMACGMMFDILPAKSSGLLSKSFYDVKVMESGSRLMVSKSIDSGEYKGLVIEKEYCLPQNSNALDIRINIKNTDQSDQKFTYRIQNIIRPANGIYTWPSADWLQVYVRNIGKDKISWDIGTEKLIQGWMAKTFDDGTAILFQFDLKSVYKTYNYYTDTLETLEWYYSTIKLAPGETWSTQCRIVVLNKTGTVFYADEKIAVGVRPHLFPVENPVITITGIKDELAGIAQINEKNEKISLKNGDAASINLAGNIKNIKLKLGDINTEFGDKRSLNFVKPVELPVPAEMPDLSGKMLTFFPYAIDGPPIAFAESAGSQHNKYANLYERMIGDGIKAYINLFYSGRLHQDVYIDECTDKDGGNILFEKLRKYDCMAALNSPLFGKADVDMEKARPAIKEKINKCFTPKARALINKYQDLILCYFIADEPFPQNIPSMLFAQDELRKIDPDKPSFPYMNHNRYEYIPYVPVFLGDTYPIKNKDVSGRNPWQLINDTRSMVEKCGTKVPVWVMPQGFAYYKGTYKMPNPSEMRLMLYGALANGAKGIVFHGWLGQLWPWLYNYGYPYNIYGFMPYKPVWDIVGECGREITAIGSTLLSAYPDPKFDRAFVTCNDYKSFNGLYNGKAIILTCLKQIKAGGCFLAVQNQNIEKAERGTLKISADLYYGNVIYNLTSMRKVDKQDIPLELVPGGVEFFYLGAESDAVKIFSDVRRNRYNNEFRQLRLESDFAAGVGVEFNTVENMVVKAEAAAAEKNFERAFTLITEARKEYVVKVSGTEFGNFTKEWSECGNILNDVQFLFMTCLDLVVPPKIRESTKKHKKFNNTDNPEMQKIVDMIAVDCFEYMKFDTELRHGGFVKNSEKMKSVMKKIRDDCRKAIDYIKLNEVKIKPDNPLN